jgi:hypothetical protein
MLLTLLEEGDENSIEEFLKNSDSISIISELIKIGTDPSRKYLWKQVNLLLKRFLPDIRIINFYLDSLADPNWPGYSEAFNQLLEIGDIILEPLEQQISKAIEQKDEMWIESLMQLKQKVLYEM